MGGTIFVLIFFLNIKSLHKYFFSTLLYSKAVDPNYF